MIHNTVLYTIHEPDPVYYPTLGRAFLISRLVGGPALLRLREGGRKRKQENRGGPRAPDLQAAPRRGPQRESWRILENLGESLRTMHVGPHALWTTCMVWTTDGLRGQFSKKLLILGLQISKFCRNFGSFGLRACNGNVCECEWLYCECERTCFCFLFGGARGPRPRGRGPTNREIKNARPVC